MRLVIEVTENERAALKTLLEKLGNPSYSQVIRQLLSFVIEGAIPLDSLRMIPKERPTFSPNLQQFSEGKPAKRHPTTDPLLARVRGPRRRGRSHEAP